MFSFSVALIILSSHPNHDSNFLLSFLDIAFYGLGLNSSSILSTIGFGGEPNVYRALHNSAVGNLVLVCAGAIPGYWFTVASVDYLGRKTIQIMGFTILTLLFAIIGFDFHHLSHGSLLALYILCQFFFNFGESSNHPPHSRSCHSLRLKVFLLSPTILHTTPPSFLKPSILNPSPNLHEQAPTQRHSLSPPSASQPASAQPPTAYPPPPAKSAR
jgi:hypothetical protein